MSSQSNRKPVFLVRSISKWTGACLSSLPKVETKRTQRRAPPVPRTEALANAKAPASVLKPLRLVEKLLRGDVVVPLPRSAKRSGLRSLVIVEQLNEFAAEVSHSSPVQEPLDAPTILEAATVEEQEPEATAVEPLASVEVASIAETAVEVSQPVKQVVGSSKSIDTATQPNTTQSPKATVNIVKGTKATPVASRKNSSAIPTKVKPDLGFKSGSRRIIKDSGDVVKSKKPAGKSGPSTTPTSPKPNRPTVKSVAPKAVPRAVPSKLTGSSTSVLERKQPMKASKLLAPALRAKSTSASGGKISSPAPASRTKPVHKPLVAARPRASAPSPHAKATTISPASRKVVKPIPHHPATKGIAHKPVGGKVLTCPRVGIDAKPIVVSVQDVPATAVVSAPVAPVQVIPVIPQESNEPREAQRALACILGDISNIPKIGTRVASSGRDVLKESPKEEPADMRTDFIGELKDRLAARKSRPSGPFTSFPKGSSTPESSQKDFRSILRSASASKRVPESKAVEAEEVSELQRVFQKRGNKICELRVLGSKDIIPDEMIIAALASRI
ncbi:hypothetical protein BD779DRAFT_1674223 [Infundibulicybe gibba]|nr:hypothetical protein BD779DRAFT_1674223 [Infundibulicybe gibba]